MPLRILPPDTEKRKAKRGVTPGRSKSSYWPKTPYKDYTKYKHSDLIKTSTGKTGKIVEKGSPGQEGRTHTKAMKRLNELQKIKSREGTRMTSGASKKRKEHLQSGGYKAGGRAGFKHGKWVRATGIPHADIAKYVDKKTGKEIDDKKSSRARISDTTMEFKKPRRSAGPSAGRQARKKLQHGELNRGYKDGKRVGLKHGTRGPHGFGPKPFLNKPGQAQGTHGGKIAKASDKALRGNKLTKKA